MLKQYSISDILYLTLQHIPYYIDTFEGTEDPNIEWPHRHAYYSLVWFTAGTGIYVIDFEEYELRADRIFLVNPQQIHNWSYSDETRGYILTVDQTLGMELNLDYHVRIDISYVHQLINRFANPSCAVCYAIPLQHIEKFNLLILQECHT